MSLPLTARAAAGDSLRHGSSQTCGKHDRRWWAGFDRKENSWSTDGAWRLRYRLARAAGRPQDEAGRRP